MNELFRHFATRVAAVVGSKGAFFVALAIVLAWGLSGPYFHYSDTWQLVINTSTTIVTFLMVFIIQYTQNRESRAMGLKLDELIRSIEEARNSMMSLENQPDKRLERLSEEFKKLQSQNELDDADDLPPAKQAAT